ncbi:MAG: nucleotidyl transferase AbiEii/AbiGii toxin family protein [Candidatus Omnitrophica bacterium]|nr:nucleotidyl transferase AbiEii/AbiGii toxin family protein [Candidatus Omnitrophota bacterium]MBU0878588.1 nucleotidyl transferase AbiEii/AbiGii toxin family protein [Candidatus Omnitrophota bacterium]MBU1133726.1 nucleotidyl transferase AbiEii/AbiGii toxin family protein [Candidatus Omnitrophota bacterium]MBU1367329.1 nucleotidyl transferase AbiEii/AbiGii toxin family protein [Candidatus Omnitrophota bacterium]MBU1524301.1 nucleotidyl transferase AbiEii/AbiGii toxin family protein [Candidat
MFLIVISQIQKAILDSFGQIPDSEYFYLTGGTALAYFYLKHRKSNDLDFFTAEAI